MRGDGLRTQTSKERHEMDRKMLRISTFEEDDAAHLYPEDKAAISRGQIITGKITLDQYRCLLKRNYDGAVIMHWTRYHAQKVIDANSRPQSHRSPELNPFWKALEEINQAIKPLVICPHCGNALRPDRLDKHMQLKCPGPVDQDTLLANASRQATRHHHGSKVTAKQQTAKQQAKAKARAEAKKVKVSPVNPDRNRTNHYLREKQQHMQVLKKLPGKMDCPFCHTNINCSSIEKHLKNCSQLLAYLCQHPAASRNLSS